MEFRISEKQTILIDDYSYPTIKKYRWHIIGKYVATKIKRKTIYLHRFLMGSPKNMRIDHINLDTTDNRLSNLRIASHSQNRQNTPFLLR